MTLACTYDPKFVARVSGTYRRVDEVLHYLWDPLGVSDVPEARDEYNSYLPHVFSLVVRRASAQEIADFLDRTATHTMGLSDALAPCTLI